MPQPLQHRRGTTLPASLAEGEFFFKTDTEVWYSGPTGGGAPIVVSGQDKFVVPSGAPYFLSVLLVTYDNGLLEWAIYGQSGEVLSGSGTITGTGEGTLSGLPVSLPAVLTGEDDNVDLLAAVVVNGVVNVSFFAGAKTTPAEAQLYGTIYYRLP
jgi:hypothetical protein